MPGQWFASAVAERAAAADNLSGFSSRNLHKHIDILVDGIRFWEFLGNEGAIAQLHLNLKL
jgi:hypothetical protein